MEKRCLQHQKGSYEAALCYLHQFLDLERRAEEAVQAGYMHWDVRA